MYEISFVADPSLETRPCGGGGLVTPRSRMPKGVKQSVLSVVVTKIARSMVSKASERLATNHAQGVKQSVLSVVVTKIRNSKLSKS